MHLSLWLWTLAGWNDNGELGNGSPTVQNVAVTTPVEVAGGHTWNSISAGIDHTCGVSTTGRAYCWGLNVYGRLGDGTTKDSSVPVLVTGVGSWIAIASGWEHSCGIKADGDALCWGDNAWGQLGDGTTNDKSSPAVVAGTGKWDTTSFLNFPTTYVTVPFDYPDGPETSPGMRQPH
jgi:alpha-tubulin suppressor-like RCC1 family protein